MDDVRCPMCGKLNPPEAELCLNCQARLKPVSAEPGLPQPEGQQDQEWLRGLRDEGRLEEDSAAAPNESAEGSPDASEDDMPDWLSRIRQRAQQEEDALSRIGPPPKPGESADDLPADLPEWLRGLPPADSDAGSLPEWMQGLSAASSQPSEQPEGTAEQIPAAAAPDETAQADADTDAWLASLAAWGSEEQAPQAAELPEPAQPVEPAEAPDWLASLDEPGPGQQAVEAVSAAGGPSPLPPEASAQPAEQDDWLKAFAEEAAPAEEESSEPALPALPEATLGAEPDWLADFQQSAPLEPPAQPAEEVPDWLRPVLPQALEPEAERGTSGAAADEEPPATQEGALPQAAAPEPQSAALPGAEFEAEDETGARPAFTAESLPGWTSAEQPEAPQGAESLERANIPDWLQPLRPPEGELEEAAAGLVEDMIERTGPLAGMSGVLSGENAVTYYRKPPAYAEELRVTEKQQTLANLLQSAVREESLPKPSKAEPARAPGSVARLLAALLLITAIVAGLLTPPLVGISRGLILPGTPAVEIHRLIEEIPAGTPVLVAVDYEAAFSGEMRAAALPVIQHLMNRKVHLVLVSTQPVGPLLGENLLQEAVKAGRGGVETYPIAQYSANLGYLVGGAVALRELSLPTDQFHPRPIAQLLPAPQRAEGGWDGFVLQNIQQITDFRRVVLLTDRIETARTWIEQVQPALARRVPFIVISSAQAAPLLKPYQASGQINALLSGLVGGRNYEEVARRPALAGAYWNAYLAGLLIVIAVILLGGLAQGFSALAGRGKKQTRVRG